MTQREQKIIDATFEIALALAKYSKHFEGRSNEYVARWVAIQLASVGFETEPIGSSWGVLKQ